jgi:hypothetical protein
VRISASICRFFPEEFLYDFVQASAIGAETKRRLHAKSQRARLPIRSVVLRGGIAGVMHSKNVAR